MCPYCFISFSCHFYPYLVGLVQLMGAIQPIISPPHRLLWTGSRNIYALLSTLVFCQAVINLVSSKFLSYDLDSIWTRDLDAIVHPPPCYKSWKGSGHSRSPSCLLNMEQGSDRNKSGTIVSFHYFFFFFFKLMWILSPWFMISCSDILFPTPRERNGIAKFKKLFWFRFSPFPFEDSLPNRN